MVEGGESRAGAPAAGPAGPRRPSPAPCREPGLPRGPANDRFPFPTGPWKTTRTRVGDHGGTVRPPHPPQTRDSARGSPARPGEQKLSSSSSEVGGGLTPGSPRSPPAPAGRLEAASPPAGLGAKTGGSPGTAGPARLQAVGEAGGRAPRGLEQTGPPPRLGRGCSGRLPAAGRPAGRSFSLGGLGGGHKSQGPGSPHLGPGSCSGRLWRLFHSTLSPHPCSWGLAAASPEQPHPHRLLKVSTQVNRIPHPGLLRGSGCSPRPRFMDPARSREKHCPALAHRWVLSGPCPGRICVWQSTDLFWPPGLRLGFGSRTRRKPSHREAFSSAGHRVRGGIAATAGCEVCVCERKPFTVEKNSRNPNFLQPWRASQHSLEPKNS